jgi:hypothetical protein
MRSNRWRQLAKQITKETNFKKMNELIHELKHVLCERERGERIAMTGDSSPRRTSGSAFDLPSDRHAH